MYWLGAQLLWAIKGEWAKTPEGGGRGVNCHELNAIIGLHLKSFKGVTLRMLQMYLQLIPVSRL